MVQEKGASEMSVLFLLSTHIIVGNSALGQRDPCSEPALMFLGSSPPSCFWQGYKKMPCIALQAEGD